MKIGIFDSGLGGLVIAKNIFDNLPEYDYLFFGDTANLPYGDKSADEIFKLTTKALDYLFDQDCLLVVMACNSVSAEVLRRLQQEYLPEKHPDRKILGVIIPTAERIMEQVHQKIGVLATKRTVESKAFVREIQKIDSSVEVVQQAAQSLVPLIEKGAWSEIDEHLPKYLEPLIKQDIDTLILGCTHYGIIKERIQQLVGPKIRVIAENEIIGIKLKEYLGRHNEIDSKLTKNGQRQYMVTEYSDTFRSLASKLVDGPINLEELKS